MRILVFFWIRASRRQPIEFGGLPECCHCYIQAQTNNVRVLLFIPLNYVHKPSGHRQNPVNNDECKDFLLYVIATHAVANTADEGMEEHRLNVSPSWFPYCFGTWYYTLADPIWTVNSCDPWWNQRLRQVPPTLGLKRTTLGARELLCTSWATRQRIASFSTAMGAIVIPLGSGCVCFCRACQSGVAPIRFCCSVCSLTLAVLFRFISWYFRLLFDVRRWSSRMVRRSAGRCTSATTKIMIWVVSLWVLQPPIRFGPRQVTWLVELHLSSL